MRQETLLVSVIRCFIIDVRFRGDFIIPFRDAAVDRVELFVIHRLSNALQTDDVFIFRSADEDNALVLRPTTLIQTRAYAPAYRHR